MSTQTKNGQAFEWAVALAVKKQTGFIVQEDIYSSAKRSAFNQSKKLQQVHFLESAYIAIKHILLKEKKIIKSGSGIIFYNPNSAGKIGDVRDILISVNNKTFGISCKNNHTALKHPRLSGTIDFIKKWGIDKAGCSEKYWQAVKPIFDELKKIKKKSNGLKLWSDILNKASRFYLPILDAWTSELHRVRDTDKEKELQLCKYIIAFIIGNKDFYKIIRKGKKLVVVQGFNFNNTLKIKQTKYPTCINAINNKNGGQYSKTIVFNHGYSINFRIHNAESKVIPSLKFDVQAIGLPTDGIYERSFDVL